MEKQEWNPSKYDRNAGFVPVLTNAVVSLLEPMPGEKILDLGCGDGVLTKELAKIVISTDESKPGKLVGLDGSSAMIKSCIEKIQAIDQSWLADGRVVAEVFDGQKLFESKWSGQEFDAVFSNAALHWMSQDPEGVVKGVASVLKKGGRFVSESGGHLNVLSVHSHLVAALKRRKIKAISPWYFPTVEDYSELLIAHGFEIEHIENQPRQTSLPTDITGWIDTFGAPFRSAVEEVYKDVTVSAKIWNEVIEEVAEDLSPFLSDSKGNFSLDYSRLRFKARKL
ncbi:hypothetical protein HK096_006378 [Nowakowskiella sp. JEL0078]|nr:hypothetical protein HK096_006378 [Nowakowskiella sp. JEL0078]